MALRTVSQAFRTLQNPANPNQNQAENIYDILNINGAGKSPGSTILDTAILGGPTESENWTLISVAIQGVLYRGGFDTANNTSNGVNGLLGVIQGGITLDGTQSQSNGSFAGNPSSSGLLQLPPDVTLLEDMWNPAQDPLPPSLNIPALTVPPAYNAGLPISCSIIPTTPIEIPSGVSPLVGMWMYPSTYSSGPVTGGGFAAAFLSIYYGRFTINYDDGLGAR